MQADWFEAVATRNLDFITRNLEQCCTLHNEQGLTALMIAAKNGDIELVKKLVPYEAGQQDLSGLPAAIYAYNAGHIEIMGEILQAEASYRFADDSDILMYFIQRKYNSVLLNIVHHFPSHIDYNGYSHLDHAIMSRNEYAIELLANSFEYDESAIARAISLAEEVDRKGLEDNAEAPQDPNAKCVTKPITETLCEIFHINPKQIASPEIDDLQYYARGNASILTDPCVEIASEIAGISRLSERNSVAFSDALGLFLPDEYGPASRGSTTLPIVPAPDNSGTPKRQQSPRLLSTQEQADAGLNAFNQKFPLKGSPARASAKLSNSNPFGPVLMGIYEQTYHNRPLSISGLKAMQSDTENSMSELAAGTATLDTTLLRKEYSKAILECERLRKEVQRQKLVRLHSINATVQASPVRKEVFVQTYESSSGHDGQTFDRTYAAMLEQDLVKAKVTASTTRDELLSIIHALRKEIDVKNKLLTMNSAPSNFSQSIIDNMAMALQRQTEASRAQRQAMQAKNEQIAQLHIALQRREQQVRNIQMAVKAYRASNDAEEAMQEGKEGNSTQPNMSTSRDKDFSVPTCVSVRDSLTGTGHGYQEHESGNSMATAIHLDLQGKQPVLDFPVASNLNQGVSTDTYVKLSRQNSELTEQVRQLKREVSTLKEKLGLHRDPRLATQDEIGRAHISPILLMQIENVKLKKQLAEKTKLLQKTNEQAQYNAI